MPQLKSGRHVGVLPNDMAEKFKFGSDNEIYALIVNYRLEVKSPNDLTSFLRVVYFKEGPEPPPNAEKYYSGFLVEDVVNGKAGWTNEEIEEFKHWLKTDSNVVNWAKNTFDEINDAILNSPIWSSELLTDEPEPGLPH